MDFFTKTTKSKLDQSQKKMKSAPTKKKSQSTQDDGYRAANSDAFQKSLKALIGHYKTERSTILA